MIFNEILNVLSIYIVNVIFVMSFNGVYFQDSALLEMIKTHSMITYPDSNFEFDPCSITSGTFQVGQRYLISGYSYNLSLHYYKLIRWHVPCTTNSILKNWVVRSHHNTYENIYLVRHSNIQLVVFGHQPMGIKYSSWIFMR